MAANRLGQPGLWPHGISGDLPIVLVQVKAAEDELLIRQLIQWRAYTRRRGMEILRDLVVLDQRAGEPSEQLRAALQSGIDSEILGKSGGVFVLSAEQIAADHVVLLMAATRAVLGGGRGSLAARLDHCFAVTPPEPRSSARSIATEAAAQPAKPSEGLSFWNGIGGFTRDGREYVMVIDGTAPGGPALPPAPWTNVLANPGFGCLVTEGGLGYSWAGNSQMNRLTPWSNDPTSDSPGEVIYLRDEETGEVWTPTPLPRGPRTAVTVRHGQGYTRYTHVSRNLNQDVLVLVPRDDPVKLVYLTVRNNAERPRHLSATFYAEWVLGSVRENAPLQLVCECDPQTGAVLARNAWAGPFAEKIAFVASDPRPDSVTADRAQFLGRNGSVSASCCPGARRSVRPRWPRARSVRGADDEHCARSR